MKKYFLLTSVLALAACGGGSGGGGGSSNTPARNVVVPATLHGGAIAPEDITSNQAITQMNSEVIVSSNSSLPLSRSASVTSGGVTFSSYRLDDVKFYAADAAHTADGYLQLGINDDGRIDRMFMVVGGVGADAAVARDGENSTFKAPIFEYVQDEKKGEIANSGQDESALETYRASQGWSSKGYWKLNNVTDKYEYYKLGDEASYRTVGTSETTFGSLESLETEHNLNGGHWNRTDEVLPVVTYGGNIDGEGTALQYSDFGRFNPVYKTKRVFLNGGDESSGWTHDVSKSGEYKEHDNDAMIVELAKEDYQLFAGGYAIHGTTMDEDRPSLNPVSGQTYKGMAVGRVYTSVECNGCSFADKKAAATAYGITFNPSITEDDFNNQEIGRDIAKEFRTYEATMEVTTEGGKIAETLTMPFYTSPVTATPQYYDVEIKQVDGVMDHVTFDAADENDIASQYRLHGADSSWNYAEVSFNPGYYGVNTPSEAAGTAAIRARQENAKGYGEKRDYEVQAAWGMKLQEP
ncbi:MAG: hypothetical protein IKP05_01165 [Alphaproteobacteria bacterium]|nr:hypothetical protein [Alphaproteobacteria bacterium]